MDEDTTSNKSTDEYDEDGLENLKKTIIEEVAQIRRKQHTRRIRYSKTKKKREQDKTARRLLESVDNIG